MTLLKKKTSMEKKKNPIKNIKNLNKKIKSRWFTVHINSVST